MLRSAAKNYQSVAVVCNPQRYSQVIAELKENDGALTEDFMRQLGLRLAATLLVMMVQFIII